MREARVHSYFVVYYHQERSHYVAHSLEKHLLGARRLTVHYLHVACIKMLPDVGGHDVPEPVQVVLPAEEL